MYESYYDDDDYDDDNDDGDDDDDDDDTDEGDHDINVYRIWKELEVGEISGRDIHTQGFAHAHKGLFTYYVSRRRGGRGYGKC